MQRTHFRVDPHHSSQEPLLSLHDIYSYNNVATCGRGRHHLRVEVDDLWTYQEFDKETTELVLN